MTDAQIGEAKALCESAQTAPQTHALAVLSLVPALIAEVERLRAERDELRFERASVSAALGDWDWDGLVADAKHGDFDSALDALKTIARLSRKFEVPR